MKKKTQLVHPRRLPTERNATPTLPKEGDEIYGGGVWRFNVTALLEWLRENPQPVVEVPATIWGFYPGKEDCHVAAADITRPIVIAEIAPDPRDFDPDIPESSWGVRGYVCIDGQHRLEKAKRLGIKTLPAVVLRMEQHSPFIFEGYDRYVEFWNEKLKDRAENVRRRYAQNVDCDYH